MKSIRYDNQAKIRAPEPDFGLRWRLMGHTINALIWPVWLGMLVGHASGYALRQLQAKAQRRALQARSEAYCKKVGIS